MGIQEVLIVVVIIALGWAGSRLWLISQRGQLSGILRTVAKVAFVLTILPTWGTSLLFACWSQYQRGRVA